MYDWPALRGRTDQLWVGLAAELAERGIAAPDGLCRNRPAEEVWTAPDLVLAQTCGYPFARHLRGRVKLVATPSYSAPGCGPGTYSSVLVVAAGAQIRSLADLRGVRAAVNGCASFSGHWALRAAIARSGASGSAVADVLLTGSHRGSLTAVADGRADIAAIDCVVWAIAGRHLPDTTGRLKVIGHTDAAPGLPLITSAGRSEADVAAIREALIAVAGRPDMAHVLDDLMIDGFAVPGEAAYQAILEVEAAALADPAWPRQPAAQPAEA